MLTTIVFLLLTFVAICAIFLAALIKLWQKPPVIRFEFPSTLELRLPDLIFPDFPLWPQKLVIQHQHVPATEELGAQAEEPIPEEVLLYIEQESDLWAQEARRRRARLLKTEAGSWDVAFRMLQNEDNPI